MRGRPRCAPPRRARRRSTRSQSSRGEHLVPRVAAAPRSPVRGCQATSRGGSRGRCGSEPNASRRPRRPLARSRTGLGSQGSRGRSGSCAPVRERRSPPGASRPGSTTRPRPPGARRGGLARREAHGGAERRHRSTCGSEASQPSDGASTPPRTTARRRRWRWHQRGRPTPRAQCRSEVVPARGRVCARGLPRAEVASCTTPVIRPRAVLGSRTTPRAGDLRPRRRRTTPSARGRRRCLGSRGAAGQRRRASRASTVPSVPRWPTRSPM